MHSLDGKHAFITGGASGIGRAIAENFIANGAAVTIADFSESGAEVADQIGATFARCDVSDEDQVTAAFEQAVAANGKLDIVKTAGYWLDGAQDRGIKHICWDGCMFSNAVLEDQGTWNTILDAMIKVRDAHGWNE